jgi:hypothetical protein
LALLIPKKQTSLKIIDIIAKRNSKLQEKYSTAVSKSSASPNRTRKRTIDYDEKNIDNLILRASPLS